MNIVNRSLRENLTRRNTVSIEKIPLKILPTSKPSGIYQARIDNLRNISARINTRVKKSKSLLDISDSKENTYIKDDKPHQNLEKSLITNREKSPKVSVPVANPLKPGPRIMPSYSNKFSTDLSKLESKLLDFYSSTLKT